MRRTAIILSAATLVLIFSACKGRTMENMEPAGETVEVNIDTVADVSDTPLDLDTIAE